MKRKKEKNIFENVTLLNIRHIGLKEVVDEIMQINDVKGLDFFTVKINK